MHGQFNIPEKDLVRVDEDALREVVVALFEKMGVPHDDCVVAADVLITADLRGVGSHGVSNELKQYMIGYRNGQLKADPRWRILRQSPSTASIDCDAGLGIIIAPKAMEIAIQKAGEVGMGMVTMCNGRHLGMAAYHAMMALEHDMIGMCMSVPPPSMPPTFGAEKRVGTNPIAVAAPAEKEAPFVYDAATTLVPFNKLVLARRLGKNLPAGWVADAEGNPVMEETPPPNPEDENKQGWNMFLLPLGSTPELGSHKGYGLSCIVEIMSGVLTGGGYGFKLGRPNFNHCVAAVKIDAFMEIEEFKRTMDEWLELLRTTRPAKGYDRVYYPGLMEAEHEAECRNRGVPLHHEVVDFIRSECKELAVPCAF